MIKGCVDKKGALRIANTCKKGETALGVEPEGPGGRERCLRAQPVRRARPARAPASRPTSAATPSRAARPPSPPRWTASRARSPSKSLRDRRQNTAGSGGGGGAGKVAFGNVRFAKLYDASSPKLLLRTATGQHLATATFTFKEAAAVTTYKLTDVTVVDYEQGGDKDRPMLEHVELNFAKVEVTPPAGERRAVTAGWDIKLNKSHLTRPEVAAVVAATLRGHDRGDHLFLNRGLDGIADRPTFSDRLGARPWPACAPTGQRAA